MRRLAVLQVQSADVSLELLVDGCLDRRLPVLLDQIDSLFEDPEAIAALTRDERSQLHSVAPAIKVLCRRMDELGLPATLVHGDFHLDNVVRLNGQLMFSTGQTPAFQSVLRSHVRSLGEERTLNAKQ